MIDQVRRFNRAVTQRAGALDDEFLARGRPLEIAEPGETTVTYLGRAL